MDNQDKIFDKFKEAAHNSESKDFPGMEKVWSRLEDKLDKKEDKKTISLWKKIAVAASLLLLISLGAQFLKSDKVDTTQIPKVVVNKEEKEAIQNPTLEKNKDVVTTDSEIIPKTEAVKILDKQIKEQQQVVMQDVQISANDAIITEPSPSPVTGQIASPVSVQSGFSNLERRKYNHQS